MREKKEELRKEKALVVAEVEDLRLAVLAERSQEGPLRASQARFSDDELAEFNSLWQDSSFSKRMVDQDVRRGPKLRRRPHAEVERALGLVELPPQEAKVERPHWVAVLCCHRLWFADALIRVDAPGHQTFYQFAFALQNPYLLCLVRAMKIEDPGLAMMQIDRGRLRSSDWEHWFFRYT